jgi:hypothetical protein
VNVVPVAAQLASPPSEAGSCKGNYPFEGEDALGSPPSTKEETMPLRDELKQMVEDWFGQTDAGFRSWVEGGEPVLLSSGEATLFLVEYSRTILECVYRLADEIDALKLDTAP